MKNLSCVFFEVLPKLLTVLEKKIPVSTGCTYSDLK